MKKLNYIIRFIIVFIIVGAASCTDGFDEMNKDPNSFNKADPVNVFAGVVKNTLNLITPALLDHKVVNCQGFPTPTEMTGIGKHAM
jgi:hypothetical protein